MTDDSSESRAPVRDPHGPLRFFVTGVFVAVAVVLCAGLWLSVPQVDATVLQRYTGRWVVMAVSASIMAVWYLVFIYRLLWRRQLSGKPPRSLRKALCFAGMAMAGPVVVAEIALHIVAGPPSGSSDRQLKVADNYHAHLQVADRTLVDGILRRTFRGSAYDRQKNTRWRIVCLGGSTTYGHRLRHTEAWPAQLEDRLRRGGHDVEVINAGMPWYTANHSIVNYALNVRYLNADVVVIMHGYNDLLRSWPEPGESGPEWDYGSYQGPMRDLLKQAQAQPEPPSLLRRSAIIRLIDDATLLRTYYYSAWRRSAVRPPTSRSRTNRMLFPTREPFTAHLSYLIELCRRDGRDVLLATQAHVDRPTYRPSWRPRVSTDGGEDTAPLSSHMKEVRLVIEKIAETHDVPLVDIESAIGRRVEYFLDEVHLTPAANKIVAREFAEALAPHLIAYTPLPPHDLSAK